MKYKLICLDMDGTLLNDDKQISDRNKAAVKQAIEKGVKVIVCTGRLFTTAYEYSEILGIEAPVISSNGAFIREKDKDEVIYKSVIGLENLKIVLDIIKKYELCPNFHTPDSIFTDEGNNLYEMYLKFNKGAAPTNKVNISIIDNWDDIFRKYGNEIVKAIVVDNDIEKLKKAKDELSQKEELEVVSSFSNNFEVMKKGVSKGRAVKILAGFYGIKEDEIICIGDNENDLSMIEYAGLGIAMGNSEQSVLNIANYITDTNNNDGVAKAIEKFILRDN